MPAEAWAVPITVGERTNPSDRVARGSGTQDPISRGHMAGQANRIDDTTLIRQAQQGNRAAFEELVRHYDQAVLRLALHLTGSEADTRHFSRRLPEGLQERRQFSLRVLVLYLDLPDRDEPVPGPFAKTTGAEGKCSGGIDGFGRRGIQPARPRAGWKGGGESGAGFHGAGTGEQINHALDRLTPRERMVFELKHYHGLKLRTVGEILNTTEETAKNTLFRATQKLRGSLSDMR